MFKVECLGCQAPYQVDEKRVPEKGLKMRCPKCGTSFKVEPPPQARPQSDATAAAEVSAAAPPAPTGFTSGGAELDRKLGKAPGPRDGLGQTMIGVSAVDLKMLTKPSAPEPAKPKPFRMPRPNQPAIDTAGAQPPKGVAGPAELSRPFEPDPPPAPVAQALRLVRDGGELDEASLPAVSGARDPDADLPSVGQARAMPRAAIPKPEAEWLSAEALASAPPESLEEPMPLSLTDLPQPVPGPGRVASPEPAGRAAEVTASSLKLDLDHDVPAPSPVRVPPPRKFKAARTDAEDTAVDLPARLEDLEGSLPALGAPGRPAPRDRRAPPKPKSSSLDELDLPAIAAARGLADAALPAPRSPARISSAEADSRSLTPLQNAATGLSDLDLPAVGGGALSPTLPDLPALSTVNLPDVIAAGLPQVPEAGLPDVVAAGLPDVMAAGLPDVLHAGLPTLSDTGLPEVLAHGLSGFGRVDLPVAREAGLPEVRTAGARLNELDLPGVGESLPALADTGWGEANLPLVGESLPTAKSPRQASKPRASAFGDESLSADSEPFGAFGAPGADDDPFSGSEADFGSVEGDPFGGQDEAFGSSDTAGGRAGAARVRSGPGASYGEVDIAGSGADADAPLETVDDMEFRAVPQRSSAPPGHAAASAAVHAHGIDPDTMGATLELGPARSTASRARTRRMLAVLAICTAAVAGGALALKPALGPFGIHFILDQVKRGEHERLLTQLVAEGRKNMGADTLEGARNVLGSLDAARQQAPRFEPLAARAAFAYHATALRFGPLPKLEAAGKLALDQLDPESDSAGHRLARAARAVAARDPAAKGALEALGADPDARQLLAELALANAEWERAAQLWAELASADPGSARAAYGVGQAQLGLGKSTEALVQVQRVLDINPQHVGAHVLRLEAHRALQDSGGKDAESTGTESLVEAIKGALPRASPGEAALAHSVLGELHLSQGRSGPAQHSFEESLGIDRTFPRALVGLGETLHLAGRHAEALARFEAAAHVEPSSLYAELGIAKSQIQLARVPEAKVILARLQQANKTRPEVIYWMAKAEQALGAHDAALLAYRSAIELGKGRADSVDAYLALAQLQSELGQLALAQQTLSEARDKLPPSGPLYRALGEIAMNRAEYAEGYAQFQKALDLESGDTRARFLGAVALTRLGRFEEAMAAFQSVGETDKDFPGLAIERGRLFEESGRNEEALKEYEAAFVKTPDDVELQIRVGCGRVIAGQSATAEPLLETVLKARPRSAEAFYCLGRALFEQERFVDAILRLERAVNLDSTRAVYHLYVGWVAAEVGRHGDAESALEKALELDKGLADAYWQRGRLRLKQGAVKDALRDLDRALELKPTRHEARADLAVAYADLGRMPQALSHWEDAIARDADNPTWHFRYGKLLSSAGNGAQAVAHLKRAVSLVAGSEGALPGASNPKPPVWLWQAHYLLGRELGLVAAAIPHWQAYLRLSPADDPYRREAERALQTLGQPWEQR